jgi:hypothetical protein
MDEPLVSFHGTRLTVGDVSWEVAHTILEAFLVGSRVVVLYDPDAYRETFGQFPNLIAFSVSGEKLWTAELPTNESGDRYYRTYLSDGLMADSPKSFACRIDESSGRILRKVFYK